MVPHPDFVFAHPKTGRTIVPVTSDGALKILDLTLVAAIDAGKGPARRGREHS